MRRLRRRTELQDKQDRIKMGLLPPDAPKGECSFPIVPSSSRFRTDLLALEPSSIVQYDASFDSGCDCGSYQSGG